MVAERRRSTARIRIACDGIFLAALLCASLAYGQPGNRDNQASNQNNQAQPTALEKAAAQNQSNGGDKSAAQSSSDQSKNSNEPGTSRIKITVTGATDKPVANASVYVRFDESGGIFHKQKQAEMNFKTNQDGSVKVPSVPQGKVLIQVVAKGWHTYGKWYDIEKDEEVVQIKLEPPPHWY